MPWAMLLPCSQLLCLGPAPSKDRAVGEQGSACDQGEVERWLCPALPLSSWDKRVPVRILWGSSMDPTVGARAAAAMWQVVLSQMFAQCCRSPSWCGHTAGCVPCSHPRPHHPQRAQPQHVPPHVQLPPGQGLLHRPPQLPPSPHSSSPAALQESSSLYCGSRGQHSGHLQQSLLGAVTPSSPPPGPCAL